MPCRKKIFLTRLMSCMIYLSDKRKGFIPDIITILHLYDPIEYLQDWLYTGTFPIKDSSKKIVRRVLKSSHDRHQERRMSHDADFFFFNEIFCKFIPSSVWKLPSTHDEIDLYKFIAKLCTKMHCNFNCKYGYLCVV